jgi:hypothetical protein
MAEHVLAKSFTPRQLRGIWLVSGARVLLATLRRRLAGTSGSYRPERHYTSAIRETAPNHDLKIWREHAPTTWSYK